MAEVDLPGIGLWTTSVGSLPKPSYLLEARSKKARGKIDVEELRNLEQRATKEWIEFQNSIDTDLVVDGEQYRGDMVAYFAEEMPGLEIGGLVRSYGNRYYRKPIAIGAVGRDHPLTVDWWQFAQALTDKPVKGMLTGPYTICDWSFNEHYDNRRDFVLDLARAIRDEALDLERAGARYIQIDEPAASTRMDELDLVIEAMKIVTEPLSVHTITHICYGDFHNAYPKMLEIPVDQIDLEFANSEYALLDAFERAPFDKYIGLGVVDVHSHVIETVEEIADGIRRSLRYIPAERMFVDPDCGLKTRTVDEAKKLLTHVKQAVDFVRSEVSVALR
ncbi:MAG: 5-methyltetrahydropteroyltriglutamate--homocysteine methyltransferase [Actinomycetota bacterium]|jgi:5-methyltetrahydropteroyltriglutamate--homocysteine methyltransferase|nr:5-methyltetrahydropteroyltriglutamate--homocysteine methyltransferase [Actinomycetota bacterium]